jgi:hypothetical protein
MTENHGVGGSIPPPGTTPDTAKADVAQLVEQLTRNEQVSGSSPLIGSSPPLPSWNSLKNTDRFDPFTV